MRTYPFFHHSQRKRKEKEEEKKRIDLSFHFFQSDWRKILLSSQGTKLPVYQRGHKCFTPVLSPYRPRAGLHSPASCGALWWTAVSVLLILTWESSEGQVHLGTPQQRLRANIPGQNVSPRVHRRLVIALSTNKSTLSPLMALFAYCKSLVGTLPLEVGNHNFFFFFLNGLEIRHFNLRYWNKCADLQSW